MGSTTVRVVFKLERGSLKVIVKRNGIEVCSNSLTEPGVMPLSDVERGDEIVLEGKSPLGGTLVMIGLPTHPPTPTYYQTGDILDRYTIL